MGNHMFYNWWINIIMGINLMEREPSWKEVLIPYIKVLGMWLFLYLMIDFASFEVMVAFGLSIIIWRVMP
jgi:hypothetical protein